MIEADAIKNRDVLFKHLSTSDLGRHDPMLSSYVHEYSTKAAEMMLVFAGAPSTATLRLHVKPQAPHAWAQVTCCAPGEQLL